MKNVFYFKNINSIGGVEAFFWYLSRSFSNMVIYYKEADPNQVARIAKNVEIKKYKEPIKCDQFFDCYGIDINIQRITDDYVDIDDGTIDIDYPEIINQIERR